VSEEPPQFTLADASSMPTSISFTDQASGKLVFTIKPGGVLEAGPGLSPDEATRELFACMVKVFPDLMIYLSLSK
jgi:hypothetical protein